MYSKGTPIAQPVYLRHDYTELGAEPGGGTTPLQCHLAPDHTRGEGIGGLPTRDVPPIDNGMLFDSVVLPIAEVGSQIPLPKVRSRPHVTVWMYVITCLRLEGGSFVTSVLIYPSSLERPR